MFDSAERYFGQSFEIIKSDLLANGEVTFNIYDTELSSGKRQLVRGKIVMIWSDGTYHAELYTFDADNFPMFYTPLYSTCSYDYIEDAAEDVRVELEERIKARDIWHKQKERKEFAC